MAINLTDLKLTISADIANNGVIEILDMIDTPIYKLMIEKIQPVELCLKEVKINWTDLDENIQNYYISQDENILQNGTDFQIDCIEVIINFKYRVIVKSYNAFESLFILK